LKIDEIKRADLVPRLRLGMQAPRLCLAYSCCGLRRDRATPATKLRLGY
jgi:hypothetical protein